MERLHIYYIPGRSKNQYIKIGDSEMTYHYSVLENASEIIICTSRSVAIDFVREIYKEDPGHASVCHYAIYNDKTEKITNLREAKIMDNKTLFEKAKKAMDSYAQAIMMGADDFANYFFARFKEYCKEIKSRGLDAEFEEFTLII